MFRRQPIVALLILASWRRAPRQPPVRAPRSRARPRPASLLTASPSPSPSPTARADAFADAIPDAHSGDTEPDDRATDALADAHHDDRPRVLPAARMCSGGEVVNEPALVPVLRTVPKSTATATAAMKALLAGPSAKERSATAKIVTVIPDGTKLLGIEISGGLATVDLSAEFASTSPADAWDGGCSSSADVWPRSSTP